MRGWDLYRRRRLPRAYVMYFAVFIPIAFLVTNTLGTPWMMGHVRALMGASA